MIPRKKKPCIQCGVPKIIFSHGRCQSCAKLVSLTVKKLKKKENKETIGQLVNQLDKVFSEYIRLRDADSEGIVTCYTSGKRAHWKKMQAGHFISRRHYGTRWNEINVQVQSVKDNIFNQGNTPEFGRRLVQDYGQQAVDMLFYLRDTPAKLNRISLKLLIGQYTEMVSQIKNRLGIPK